MKYENVAASKSISNMEYSTLILSLLSNYLPEFKSPNISRSIPKPNDKSENLNAKHYSTHLHGRIAREVWSVGARANRWKGEEPIQLRR